MFTGIIEELGRIAELDSNAGGVKIKIASQIVTDGTSEGDSIAVNGVCLTALNITPDSFEADVSQETLDRSTLGGLKTGSAVNLERAVTPSTRLGGHIVQGHVDGRGTFVSAFQNGDFWTVRIGFAAEMARYFVYKGSVSIEGISLTIASLGDSHFEIAVIPKTWEQTNLSTLNSGDAVNLEADVIAKYVERMLGFNQTPDEGVTKETLKKAGFI
ncbi:MAG: riboflavin synthase [Pyrinomonadaceae bacterium]